MSIQLRCPCGQMLNVPDSAIGKKVRCPKCKILLQLPVVATPVKPAPAPDPFADLTASLPQPAYQRPIANPSTPAYPAARYSAAPAYAAAQGNAAGRGFLIPMLVAVLGIAVLAAGGVTAWLVIPLLTRPSQIEDSFVPTATVASQPEATKPSETSPEQPSVAAIAPVGRSARETAMLAVAEKFVRHARQNEHHDAVAMIDTKLFHARLYSAKGSYEAMTKDIPAAKLLSNFGNYALDGAPVGGHRHWQIIGTSQFEGNQGVVLRYYVEPQSPLEALTDSKLFNRLGAVISYDQMTQKAGNLFTSDGQKSSHFDHYRLSRHAIKSAFPSRAGYMMLVFDGQEAEPKLIDLVNVLGQAPLSRTGAHVFLDDYHTFGGFGSRETYGTKGTTMTVFGLSANSMGGTWDPNVPGAEERAMKQIAAAEAAEEQKRPKRLEKLVQLWDQGDAKWQSELERFRQDFPNDLGFELAVVCEKMAVPKPTFPASQDQMVSKAVKALYQQWRDPFFQYVEALNDLHNGRQSQADALFAKCVAEGFATTDYYISRIESALDRSDTAGILLALEEWNRTLAVDGLPVDKDRLTKLASKYESLERSLNPQPSLSEMMSAGARGPLAGRFSRPGSQPDTGSTPSDPRSQSGTAQASLPDGASSPPKLASRSGEFGMGPPPGYGQPPPDRVPPFGPGQTPFRPPAMSGPQVVIKISSNHGFDGNAITKKVIASLGIKGHQFSQSGQSAELKILFAGTVQDVVRAIDFGIVKAQDEATRTIEVTIP